MKKQVCAGICGLLAGSTLIVASYYFVSWMSQTLSLPLALAVHCVLLLVLVQSVVGVVIFPGSCWFWRRSLEAVFCEELTRDLHYHVSSFLKGLRLNPHSIQDQRPFSFRLGSQLLGKNFIVATIENFTRLEALGFLTLTQKQMMTYLRQLETLLVEVKVHLPSNEQVSYWEWIEVATENRDWANVVISHTEPALTACESLLQFIETTVLDVPAKKAMNNWLFNTTFGTLMQMRVDLARRLPLEEIWVVAKDGRKIDCIWVPAKTDSEVAMLLLNPNAGLMEFAYFQNEWLHFYSSRGINVMLTNYRGYGRSEGIPTPSLLKSDAETILKYIRTVKGAKKVGVHGESLGGMIAAHLGKVGEVDYLVADRTFASLPEAALHNFGKAVHWIARILTFHWNTNATSDYLQAPCYKVIAADSQDQMIRDLGSLKSGVVRIVLGKGLHLFQEYQFDMFFNSLRALVTLTLEYDVEPEFIDSFTKESLYAPIAKDTERNSIEALIREVYQTLEKLDAGGTSLVSVCTEKNPRLSLQHWVSGLHLWGSYTEITPGTDPRTYAIDQLKNAIGQLHVLCQPHNFSPDPTISLILTHTKQVQASLAILEGELESPLSTSFEAGKLVPLACGHSGQLSDAELKLMDWHLSHSGLLDSQVVLGI